VTSQAVSEYIRDLVDEEFVEKAGPDIASPTKVSTGSFEPRTTFAASPTTSPATSSAR